MQVHYFLEHCRAFFSHEANYKDNWYSKSTFSKFFQSFKWILMQKLPTKHKMLAFCFCFYFKLGIVDLVIAIINSLSLELEQVDLAFIIFKSSNFVSHMWYSIPALSPSERIPVSAWAVMCRQKKAYSLKESLEQHRSKGEYEDI